MEITARGLVGVLHGLLFGGFFLMAIYGLGIEGFRSAYMKGSPALTERGCRLERAYLIVVTGVCWIAVLSGAYVVYPWYRAVPPAGAADLALYPQRLLMSSPATSGWHRLGMEWKEHVAWLTPIAMTMVAYVFIRYGPRLTHHRLLRNAVLGFVAVAFFATAVAGVFGAFLNKTAPIRGGPELVLMRVR